MFHRHRFNDDPQRRAYRRIAWGGVLIVIGLAVLLQDRFGLGPHDFGLIAPAVVAWSGLVLMAVERTPAAILRGVFRLAIAAYLYVVIEHVQGWTMHDTWPVLLMVIGVATVLRALFDRSPRSCDRSW